MKTLYITDLDETLLNANSTISQYSASIINKIIEEGSLFSYVTSRGTTSAYRFTSSLKINIPVILYDGTFIATPNAKEILISNTFNAEDIIFLKNLFAKYNLVPNSYSNVNGKEKISVMPEIYNPGKKYYLDLIAGNEKLNFVDNIDELYTNKNIYSFICIGYDNKLKPLYEEIQNRSNINCILNEDPYQEDLWCIISPFDATRAKSILKLKEMLNCDKVVCFGNGLNDISMFKIADECYAVSNAVQELKDISTGIIDSNDNDGVAKWLKEHILDVKKGRPQ